MRVHFTQQEVNAQQGGYSALIAARIPRRAQNIYVQPTYSDGAYAQYDLGPHPRTILTRHASRTARLKPRWQRTTQGATA